jgi:hypothetical protein
MKRKRLPEHLPGIEFPDQAEEFVANVIFLFFPDEVRSNESAENYGSNDRKK